MVATKITIILVDCGDIGELCAPPTAVGATWHKHKCHSSHAQCAPSHVMRKYWIWRTRWYERGTYARVSVRAFTQYLSARMRACVHECRRTCLCACVRTTEPVCWLTNLPDYTDDEQNDNDERGAADDSVNPPWRLRWRWARGHASPHRYNVARHR